jgi:hypothetical protein
VQAHKLRLDCHCASRNRTATLVTAEVGPHLDSQGDRLAPISQEPAHVRSFRFAQRHHRLLGAVGDTTLEQKLRGVAELANAAVCGSDMVGVTMLVAGRPRTAASTDDTVSEVDDFQCRSGVGPCLDACADQRVRRVDSTDNEDRWPAFGRAARLRGILSSMSLPLVAHHEGIGALNCYSRTATAFSADDELVAAPFELAAAMTRAYLDARRAGERLGLALQSPATIERAKAILMAARRYGPRLRQGSGFPTTGAEPSWRTSSRVATTYTRPSPVGLPKEHRHADAF